MKYLSYIFATVVVAAFVLATQIAEYAAFMYDHWVMTSALATMVANVLVKITPWHGDDALFTIMWNAFKAGRK